LWGFVKEFLSKNQDAASEIDHAFKRRFWRYLLGHEELILKEDEQVLFSGHIKTEETVNPPERKVLTARIQTLLFGIWTKSLRITMQKNYVYSHRKKRSGRISLASLGTAIL
jgi:hypothetical protein